jgi:DNA-binding NtrC family response regulator
MKTTLRILIVEDDKYFLQHLREILSSFGVLEAATDWPSAAHLLKNHHYDLVVTDLHLPGGPEGIQVLDAARNQHAMRIMLTSSNDDALIRLAYAQGAQHVLTKAQAREHLPAFVRSVVTHRDHQKLSRIFDERFPTKDGVLIADITRLLTSPWQGRSLLITGPTGTGKSVLGKLLAESIAGAGAPFVHINCSEIPDNLLESELFGHEKGAFTGADQKREGKLKAADGGVLFLDEVGTMSPAMQQKLLKAIEEKTFFPVGATKQERSAFTLITATCENLPEKIRHGSFREDLFFRIAGLMVRLPPLAERRGDIEGFVRFFQNQSPRRFVMTPEATRLLTERRWPGNIRELRQAILALADINIGVVDVASLEKVLGGVAGAASATGILNDDIRDFVRENGLRGYFQHIEKELAKEALERHQGKITLCIRELKISSSAFYRILQEHQLG